MIVQSTKKWIWKKIYCVVVHEFDPNLSHRGNRQSDSLIRSERESEECVCTAWYAGTYFSITCSFSLSREALAPSGETSFVAFSKITTSSRRRYRGVTYVCSYLHPIPSNQSFEMRDSDGRTSQQQKQRETLDQLLSIRISCKTFSHAYATRTYRFCYCFRLTLRRLGLWCCCCTGRWAHTQTHASSSALRKPTRIDVLARKNWSKLFLIHRSSNVSIERVQSGEKCAIWRAGAEKNFMASSSRSWNQRRNSRRILAQTRDSKPRRRIHKKTPPRRTKIRTF